MKPKYKILAKAWEGKVNELRFNLARLPISMLEDCLVYYKDSDNQQLIDNLQDNLAQVKKQKQKLLLEVKKLELEAELALHNSRSVECFWREVGGRIT